MSGGIAFNHQPVLLNEALDGLAIKPDGIYIDGTFGRGGHAKAILEKLNQQGRLYAIDKDPEAIQAANALFADDARFCIEQASFADIKAIAERHQLIGKIDGILLDIGVSSPQLEDPERGFSLLHDGSLDMRMNPDKGMSASAWLATASVENIARVLRDFGEERFAKRIANAIAIARKQEPITRTLQLAEIIKVANPKWEKHKHPATRSFQAIRIFINNELSDLQHVLTDALSVLAVHGRLVVISFHSLEDRMVKRFMRAQSGSNHIPVGLPVTEAQIKRRLLVIGKPIKASLEEIKQNPRARSAVLRIGEKLL